MSLHKATTQRPTQTAQLIAEYFNSFWQDHDLHYEPRGKEVWKITSRGAYKINADIVELYSKDWDFQRWLERSR